MVFRSKMRQHTCRIILFTSIVWLLIDLVLITFYADCLGNCKGDRDSAEALGFKVEEVNDGVDDYVEDSHVNSVHKEDSVDSFKLTYKPSDLRRWKPVRPVPRNPNGVGEGGQPVVMPEDQEALAKEKFKINQFNLVASDMIALNRSLEDARLDG